MSRTYKTRKLTSSLTYNILIMLFGLIMIYPVIWMISGSFKTNFEILNKSLTLIPEKMDMTNYINGWKGFGRMGFAIFFKNSFIITILATLGVVVSSSLVAYAFSRLHFPGRKVLFICMISTLMLPTQVVMIPQYLIFRNMGFVNNYLPLILPSWFTNAFFTFMIMQFIMGLPKELDDAAIIDGCSKYSIYTRIILPLINPALITTVIINFYWKWDDFMGPLIYLSRPQKYPVSLAIKLFADSTSTTDYGAMFAMSTLSLIPVFLIFLFFNKYLIQGMSTSGLKG